MGRNSGHNRAATSPQLNFNVAGHSPARSPHEQRKRYDRRSLRARFGGQNLRAVSTSPVQKPRAVQGGDSRVAEPGCGLRHHRRDSEEAFGESVARDRAPLLPRSHRTKTAPSQTLPKRKQVPVASGAAAPKRIAQRQCAAIHHNEDRARTAHCPN